METLAEGCKKLASKRVQQSSSDLKALSAGAAVRMHAAVLSSNYLGYAQLPTMCPLISKN